MAKFKFEDYELVEAYKKTTFLVDADNLEDAKQKVLDMYVRTMGDVDNDDNDIEIVNCEIARANHFHINEQFGTPGFGICCEDNTMTNFDRFE